MKRLSISYPERQSRSKRNQQKALPNPAVMGAEEESLAMGVLLVAWCGLKPLPLQGSYMKRLSI
jgi:hypothetical protein